MLAVLDIDHAGDVKPHSDTAVLPRSPAAKALKLLLKAAKECAHYPP